eukprot:gnl/MRDRNA2_/MRDRNA2_529397_c0_seq1.p1 gnl/MRDRNA2_/MRDRNA2_529397_c0~~gnl/MRDRNA2_/MRDRNA2_529397_c0_seq1.p1  ORF type:complete len:130 (-),score=18.80 gnl/MRDRNA2_/MRDRNA2_529397_c0_seq1:62-451(-)
MQNLNAPQQQQVQRQGGPKPRHASHQGEARRLPILLAQRDPSEQTHRNPKAKHAEDEATGCEVLKVPSVPHSILVWSKQDCQDPTIKLAGGAPTGSQGPKEAKRSKDGKRYKEHTPANLLQIHLHIGQK